MNTNFVMTNDDLAEMKEKVDDAKRIGIRPKYLALTSYEKRVQVQDIDALHGWEPDEEFLQWLLQDES